MDNPCIKNKGSGNVRLRLIVLVLIGLSGLLMTLLLSSNYLSQVKLRISAAEYFHQQAKRDALQVGQFLKGVEGVITRLSESRELTSFDENKALGMSMEYGLKASLIAIEQKFQDSLDNSIFAGVKYFKGITFNDINGSIITQKGNNLTAAIRRKLDQQLDPKTLTEIRYFVFSQGHEITIILAKPYSFKGHVTGTLLAVLNNAAFQGFLLSENSTNGEQTGIGFNKTYIPLNQSNDEKDVLMNSHDNICHQENRSDPYLVCHSRPSVKRDALFFEIPVENTPFQLMVTIPARIVWGGNSPELSLIMYLAVFIVFSTVIFMLWRASIHNATLKSGLEEQSRHTVEIGEKVKERTIELLEAKEKAAKGEAWWQSLMQEVPAVTFILNRGGDIRYANSPFAGRSTEQLNGLFLPDLFDVNEKTTLEKVLARVLEERISIRHETRFINALGETLWYENHLGPIDTNGAVSGVICLSFDVTERKHTDDLLREMSLAVEFSPVSAVITDRFGIIEYVNPKFTASTGYRFDEVQGKILRIMRKGELLSDQHEKMLQTLQSGKEWHEDFKEKHKDGSEFWESVTIAPVIGKDGKPGHFIVLKQDITERRRAMTQRETDLKFLRDLLDAIPNPVFYKDNSNVYQGCNKAFEELIGMKRSRIIGRNLDDVTPQEINAILFKGNEAQLQSTGRTAYETRVRFHDGTMHEVLCFNSLLQKSDGASSGFVGVMLDITDRKQMEEELFSNQTQLMSALEEVKMYNQQLEQAQGQLVQQEKLAAIGFLAAGVAHEINNPLGFVHGNITALEEYAQSLLTMIAFLTPIGEAIESKDLSRAARIKEEIDTAKEKFEIDYIVNDVGKLLQETRQGLDRIKNIVHGLRSFSRTDSGGMILANINDILDGVVNIAWNEVKYKAELEKNYSNIPMVMCNPQQLGQVFVNLLVNAAQAIPEKGVITLKTYQRDSAIVVEVRDTGTGIPDEIKTKIFDPFFTTKEPGSGTGLGLSISYDIVKKHGGRIDLESKVGEGSVFYVVIPLNKGS
jgi:PAS domain S-box-containing protein